MISCLNKEYMMLMMMKITSKWKEFLLVHFFVNQPGGHEGRTWNDWSCNTATVWWMVYAVKSLLSIKLTDSMSVLIIVNLQMDRQLLFWRDKILKLQSLFVVYIGNGKRKSWWYQRSNYLPFESMWKHKLTVKIRFLWLKRVTAE